MTQNPINAFKIKVYNTKAHQKYTNIFTTNTKIRTHIENRKNPKKCYISTSIIHILYILYILYIYCIFYIFIY